VGGVTQSAPPQVETPVPPSARSLFGSLERWGNRLPDPALLFVFALAITWLASALLAGHAFELPSKAGPRPTQIISQLSPPALISFLTDMVPTFVGFHPLGVVLVAMLGVGVADHSGFIRAVLRRLLAVTPAALLTPMLLFVSVLSHVAADAGLVLMVPLGGAIFQAAGRRPLAGIVAAFAGVSGGFSATPLPTSLDPLLQGLTQEAAQILDPSRLVNPLCNWLFTSVSSLLIIGGGWWLTDRVIEPRLAASPGEPPSAPPPGLTETTPEERRGLRAGLVTLALIVAVLVLIVRPHDSPLRGPGGNLTDFGSPLMKAIVPLIFLLSFLPGLAHGIASHTYKSSRDVVAGMAQAMSSMGYYVVMAFCASLFIYAFNKSQLGALLAVEGAEALRALALPGSVTIIGIILLCAALDLVVGSASAKWALIAPILVPMLMQLSIAPELTQAAYRIGDSTTNIITPLMPYFPLVVSFAQRYDKGVGIGSMVSLMLPYSLLFLSIWTLLLLAFWGLGIPLGIHGVYSYP